MRRFGFLTFFVLTAALVAAGIYAAGRPRTVTAVNDPPQPDDCLTDVSRCTLAQLTAPATSTPPASGLHSDAAQGTVRSTTITTNGNGDNSGQDSFAINGDTSASGYSDGTTNSNSDTNASQDQISSTQAANPVSTTSPADPPSNTSSPPAARMGMLLHCDLAAVLRGENHVSSACDSRIDAAGAHNARIIKRI